MKWTSWNCLPLSPKEDCTTFYEFSWTVETTTRGTIQTTKKIRADEIYKPICCWRTFQRFWKRECPNLRLLRPSADICTECHTFHHRFRHTTQNINNRRLTNNNNDVVAKESSSNYFNSTTAVVAVTPTVPTKKMQMLTPSPRPWNL